MNRLHTWVWPDGLAGRTTLVLLAGLLTLHIGSVVVHEASLRSNQQEAREKAIAETLSRARRALSVIPTSERDRAAHALSSPGLEMHWRDAVPFIGDRQDVASLALVRGWLTRTSPDLQDILIGWGDTEEHHLLVGALPIGDSGSISFAAPIFQRAHEQVFDPNGFAALASIAVVVGLGSALVVRGLTKPLRELSAAADRVGRDVDSIRIAEAGPAEIRQAARAFNGMQERIQRLIEDRTQALAAVSHDLRTPITRMRLVAGFLTDPQSRDQIDASLDEMAAMVETTLAYMRGGQHQEEQRPIDLVTVLQTICDHAADVGGDVEFSSPPRLIFALRPVVMRRALSNLISNAVTYGGSAQVTLSSTTEDVVIEIADNGPGIPEASLEQVFQPFRRLEESRNRATGGVGLGLTIARRAVEAEGGTLQLVNRPEGGLSAIVRLPRRPPATSANPTQMVNAPTHPAAAS